MRHLLNAQRQSVFRIFDIFIALYFRGNWVLTSFKWAASQFGEKMIKLAKLFIGNRNVVFSFKQCQVSSPEQSIYLKFNEYKQNLI